MMSAVMALYRHSLIFMEPVLGLPISRRISEAQKLSLARCGAVGGGLIRSRNGADVGPMW